MDRFRAPRLHPRGARDILRSSPLRTTESTLHLQVLLFATYADAFGATEIVLDLPDGATVGELVTAVRARAPHAALPPHPLVAVNHAYASSGSVLSTGDEVALIPPVAGG